MKAILPVGAKPANFDLFNFDHDFILGGSPQSFLRINGRFVPAVGAEVVTSHGVGYIERRTGDNTCIVRIVDFDESPVTLWKGGDKSQPYEVAREDYVARLSDLYNNRLLQEASWLVEKYGDTKKTNEKVDLLLALALDSDCYEVRVGDDCLGADEFAYNVAKAPKLRDRKLSRAELKAKRKALEAEADAYLEDLEDAGFIADELAEFYGDE